MVTEGHCMVRVLVCTSTIHTHVYDAGAPLQRLVCASEIDLHVLTLSLARFTDEHLWCPSCGHGLMAGHAHVPGQPKLACPFTVLCSVFSPIAFHIAMSHCCDSCVRRRVCPELWCQCMHIHFMLHNMQASWCIRSTCSTSHA